MMNTNQNRNEAIDLIRGLAILSVMLLHLSIFPAFSYQLPISWLNNIIFGSGYYGVMVFFVVSGFLITNSIIKKWSCLNQIHILSFYRNRFARIVPCLLGLLILLSLLDRAHITPFVIQHTTLMSTIFSALTFQINWLEAKTGYLPASWDILWSLSIEEMFYLFFPLLCYFIRRRSVFFGVLFFFIIAGPCARSLITNEIWQDKSYLSCMDGIAWGVLAAIVSHQLTLSKTIKRRCIVIGLTLFSIVFFLRSLIFSSGLTNLGLNVTLLESSIALLLVGVDHTMKIKSYWRWLTFYGRNSYEIYLTHIPIMTGLAMLFQELHAVSISGFYLSALLLCGLLGAYVAKQYSEPLNNQLRQQPNEF